MDFQPDKSGYRQEKAKRGELITPRFCVVARSGFEPELWLLSRLRDSFHAAMPSKGAEKQARLEHERIVPAGNFSVTGWSASWLADEDCHGHWEETFSGLPGEREREETRGE